MTGKRRGGYNARMAEDERINFKYKDTVFRMLFSDKERLLSLYNALSEKRCDNVDDLKVLSLANAAKKAGQSEEEFAAGMESYFLSAGATK